MPLPVFMDDALLALDVVYAGAGDPHALLEVSAQDLQQVTAATVTDLREES